MVTKEQLLNHDGNISLHFNGQHACSRTVGPRGGITTNITNVRQSGAIKTWKTRPHDFRMPVKFGMYESWYVDHDNAGYFHLPTECPLNAADATKEPSCMQPSLGCAGSCRREYACND